MNDQLTADAADDTRLVANHVLWATLDDLFNSSGDRHFGECMIRVEDAYRAGRWWQPPTADDARRMLDALDTYPPGAQAQVTDAAERLREQT
jgi:hypothetical protein